MNIKKRKMVLHHTSPNKSVYLEMLRKFGIFFGFCIVVIALTTVIVRTSEKKWRNGLWYDVNAVLNEKFPDVWSVGRYVELMSPIAQNMACYEIVNRQNRNDENYAIILRMDTLYGPLLPVFMYDKTNIDETSIASFVGYANLHGRISQRLVANKNDARILYWENRIPKIIAKALAHNSGVEK